MVVVVVVVVVVVDWPAALVECSEYADAVDQ